MFHRFCNPSALVAEVALACMLAATSARADDGPPATVTVDSGQLILNRSSGGTLTLQSAPAQNAPHGTVSHGRDWGPEQATGAPNTPRAGDIVTAWASRTPDEQDEWLQLEYGQPVQPIAVLIYETYNPGAVREISAFRTNGREESVWQGVDPTERRSEKGVSVIPLKPDFATQKIRLRLDSKNVQGWNEIDAVGLLDASGKVQWATRATASSTFADVTTEGNVVTFTGSTAVNESTDQRLRNLESELARLRRSVDQLTRALETNRRQSREPQ